MVVQPDAVDVVGAVRPRADRPLGPAQQVVAHVVVETVVGEPGVDVVVGEDVVAALVEPRSRGIENPAEWLGEMVDGALRIAGRQTPCNDRLSLPQAATSLAREASKKAL